MSKKKEDVNVEVEETTTEEIAVEETTETDPKANWPTIYIPKRDKEDKQRLITVNFRKYMVQTGKQVQVPPEVAEVYYNSVKAEEERDRYEEEQQ